MNSLQNLIQRLSAIGQVNEEAKKPDADTKLPSMAHIKEMCEDGKTVAEICKMHPGCDQTKLKEMISDCKNKLDEGSKPDFLDIDNDGNKKEKMKDAVDDKEDGDDEVKESALDLLRRHSGIEEASKWRDAKYKDKLYTQEPPEEDQDDSEDVYYNRVKPDDYQGAKRSTFDRSRDTDKLHYPYGDYQVGKQAQVGDRAKKGLLTKNAIRVVKDRIKGTQGDHPTPKLPEGAMDSLKALGKKAMDTLGHKDDEELIKDMQKQQGMPQTGKKPSEEEIKETALNLLRRYAGIQEAKIKEDDVEEGNEFSGALKAAKDSGKEEFEVGGKKYKVNECGEDYPSSGQMSPMTMTGQEQPHMGIPAEVMAQMAAPEMSEPEGPHMEVPMEEPKATYTLNITNGDNNLSMTTDVPDEIIHIMKLAGVNKGAEVTKKEMPADGEQEVEESGYENTPDNTKARDPQAHGDIRDWGQKGTAKASTHYTPAQSGDNPMNEQRMFDDYKNFKAGK